MIPKAAFHFLEKRIAPQAPVIEIDDDQQNAIDLLASMSNPNKLIPRPIIKSNPVTKKVVPAKRKSIINKKETSLVEEISPFDSQLPRISFASDDKNFVASPDPEIHLSRSNITNPEPVIPTKPIRKYVATKKAIILCGLPDMRYYTYQKTPWILMLKREVIEINFWSFCKII